VTTGTDGAAAPDLTAQIAALVQQVADENGDWHIGPQTRLEGDLFLDSVELIALDEVLRRRYGEEIDLAGHVAGLGIDEIIGLTVADVAAYVDGRRGAR
jgi:hypothetical protein